MDALDLVRLTPLMQLSSGSPEIAIALIDGPVSLDRPELWSANVQHVSGNLPAACSRPSSTACTHGTFVAGILAARRGSRVPAICPDCTLLVRSVFPEDSKSNGQMPSAKPAELAEAILDTVHAGGRVINLSLNVIAPSTSEELQLAAALSYAARTVEVFHARGSDRTLSVSGDKDVAVPRSVATVAYSLHRHSRSKPRRTTALRKREAQRIEEQINDHPRI